MSGVKVIVRNNDGDLVQLANFLDRSGWEVVQNAEEGSVGISTLFMDDLDESVWDTLGYNDGGRRQIRLVDMTSNKIVQFGYTGRRMIRRRFDKYGKPTGRAWSIEIIDPNTYFVRRILTHKGAKRPRETDHERIEWLIGAPEWDIIDQFMIGPSESTIMSKGDLRGQTVGDVIADCAQQARKNYWIDIVDTGAGDRLTFWYGRDTRDEYESTLFISNDLDDLDVPALSNGTTTLVYPPSHDTEYQMDPSRIFTGIYGRWEKGAVYRHSVTGETQIERWDTAMDWPNIHEKDRAEDRALKMIERLADEDERIETAIIVPAAQAHLVRAGMRIPLKLTHIPRLVDYTDCRILSRGLSPLGDGAFYRIPLTLEPIEPTPVIPPSSCATSLGTLVSAAQTDQTPPPAISMSITPGVQSFIVGAVIAANHNSPADHDMTITGGGTQLYSYGGTASPAYAVGYTDDASPATMTGSFTEGFNADNDSTWATVMVAVETTATAPVQDKHDDSLSTGSHLVTLDTPPTDGNMLIMVIGLRDSVDYPAGDLSPNDGLWIDVTHATAQSNLAGGGTHDSDSVGIYARCVQTGDTSTYGCTGISKAARVSLIEVAIT